MRIAIGSDHRGGRIAKAILSEVLFQENDDEFVTIGFDLHATLVGAYLVTGDMSKKGGFVGKKVENILPKLAPADDDDPATAVQKARVLRVDYPDIAQVVASRVSAKTVNFGILVCGTGIGMSIVANKFYGVRAAVCYNEATAAMSRHHNDANVLCIPGEMLGAPSAVAMVRSWLSTAYDGGRHQIRLDKIALLEQKTGL